MELRVPLERVGLWAGGPRVVPSTRLRVPQGVLTAGHCIRLREVLYGPAPGGYLGSPGWWTVSSVSEGRGSAVVSVLSRNGESRTRPWFLPLPFRGPSTYVVHLGVLVLRGSLVGRGPGRQRSPSLVSRVLYGGRSYVVVIGPTEDSGPRLGRHVVEGRTPSCPRTATGDSSVEVSPTALKRYCAPRVSPVR